jgi:hypothetical protein
MCKIVKNNKHILDLEDAIFIQAVPLSYEGFVKYPFDICPFGEIVPCDNEQFVGMLPFFPIGYWPGKNNVRKSDTAWTLLQL